MVLRESAEMYLENVYVLSKEKERVRSVDIAKAMHFSRPSVSVTVHGLEKEGYLTIEDQSIFLTEKGLEVAKRIYERHLVISSLLKAIGVSEQTAVEDACRMEHVISSETFDCIKNAIKGKQKYDGCIVSLD